MNGLRVLVSVWFQVLFHRPHRAAFHLSLTVLVHYRCFEVFSLGRVVLPASSGPCVVRSTQEKHQRSINPAFAYRAITFCGKAFQLSSASRIFRPPPEHSNRSGKILSYNPSCDTLKRTERGLGSSLFARRYLGNKRLFSFPPGTEMFHFPGYASRLLRRDCRGSHGRVAPFGNRRIKGCSTPPRRLSQSRRVLPRLRNPRHPPYALISRSDPRILPPVGGRTGVF